MGGVARTCSCLGVRQLLCCGTAKLLHKVAREATLRQGEEVNRDGQDDTTGKSDVPWFKVVNTLRHPLLRLKEEGYQIVGLEQTASSTSLYDFKYVRKTVLVVGSENRGLPADILAVCDQGRETLLFPTNTVSSCTPLDHSGRDPPQRAATQPQRGQRGSHRALRVLQATSLVGS
jgi:tRNA(Leu) C34 or U34 (ribose-2'-O)-methylase TrmL